MDGAALLVAAAVAALATGVVPLAAVATAPQAQVFGPVDVGHFAHFFDLPAEIQLLAG